MRETDVEGKGAGLGERFCIAQGKPDGDRRALSWVPRNCPAGLWPPLTVLQVVSRLTMLWSKGVT